MVTAGGLVIALAAVPLAPIHAQGQISQLAKDSKLIFQMAGSNIMEVRLGQSAQQKASNAAVKQFAQQMVTDHTNLENQLASVVSKNGTFQPAMGKENEAEVARLEKLSGAQFDQQYMTSMIQHHQQDISLLQSEGQSATSAEARQLVAASLPVLQRHLTMASQVGGQVGATGGVAVATQPGTTTTPPTTSSTTTTQPGQVATQNQGTISASDMAFVREAAGGNLMEIRLGQLAQSKASNQAVKQFGQRMVGDHTNLQNQLTSAASTGGQTFTPAMDSRHQRQVSRLEGLSGDEFDRAYMSLMIRAHQRDVNNFQTQSQSAQSTQVRTLATNSLPVLQQHLSLAVQVGSQVGVDSTTNYAGGGNGGNQGNGANGNNDHQGNVAPDEFIRDVGADNVLQIEAARMARDKAKNSQVRQFASRIINDHTRLQNQWNTVASKRGMPAQPGMGPKHRDKLDQLKKVNGKNFDKAFMVLMVQENDHMVRYWQNEGRNSQAGEVRQLSNQGLPTLQQDLNQAKQVARQVGVNPDEALRNRSDLARDKNDKDKNKD
jgi:putative membrane protein